MSKHKRYDDSFKQDSVNLALSSQQAIEITARNIGVAKSTLASWVRNYKLGRYNNLFLCPKSQGQDH